MAPLSVNFTGTASSSLGNKINRYEWNFGNGDAYGDSKTGKDVTYTFSQPGIYKVAMIAYDAYGIPSETVMKTIKVKPQGNARVLSAWIKDSYVGNLSNKYTKQFLINGNVVWEDDVAGNEGWQHVVVDVSSYLTTGTQARLAYRLYSKEGVSSPVTQIIEVTSWLDDITVFGTTATNPDLETVVTPWRQTFYSPPATPTSVGSGTTTSDARSGETSWRFEFGYKKIIPPGVYGEFYQLITPN